MDNLDAKPRDLNQLQDCGDFKDHRTLDKLINGVNNTCDDMNMWLIPFNYGETHQIFIKFKKE